jgi:hypothetical protein
MSSSAISTHGKMLVATGEFLTLGVMLTVTLPVLLMR